MRIYKYEVFTMILEEQIKRGILIQGQRLPSVREIKNTYSLSTSSVQSGFEYLMMKGLVESSPRSGYFVAYTPDTHVSKMKTDLPPVVRDAEFAENVMLTSARNKPSESSTFNTAAPGDLLVPQKLILRTMQEVIREKGAALLRYYPSNGLDELRKQISLHTAIHGCLLNPDEIIITDGALQALTIALSAVTDPGDIVAVESPSVFSVLEAIANLGLKIIEIPIHYENGFDTEYFRNICTSNEIKAVIVTPNFHNPTGIVMNDDAKKELLKTAVSFQIPIIENDIYGDLYFGEKRPRSIKSFDDSGLVMTYSSFAKTLAPGIRLGWLHTGRFYSRSERARFVMGRSVSPIYQELMLKLLQGNSYQRHLRSFRKHLNRQALEVLNALRRYFPEDSYFHSPQGGYSIWGRLPERTDMKSFFNYCSQNKILFTPGNTFSLTGEYDHHFRIVFADRITEESMSLLESAGKKAKELAR
ncbi:aminotransferase-like domain-containing protein [Chryseobacterium vrystaatense]|uniref:DNA-binding transcriptional regulator, MocR family, contains an aminotransferase domain n=1 Tax=Chryseobacterium vrystaatense TaxID=307480 RepID=A0A1M5G5Y0_9FLAO|nr:PLP-dependent aminotransferase family protein [Chryseobacterium vrystaatense]SHF99118.1 DNA-binding transcriptional regulator, MocR family, contains an aminotransferase domain [Chryseobacterium vrystaatense]